MFFPSPMGLTLNLALQRTRSDMSLTVLPLTPERLPDLDTVFQARGCSIAKACYCMHYREAGKPPSLKAGETHASRNRAALARLANSEMPPGLLGYKNGRPAGWISLGPRKDFVRLANSPTMRSIDDHPVWSIICFVVPSEYRKQGVAHELLAAAVDFARTRGATWLEAYPVDRDAPNAPNASWFGSTSMFLKAGFTEVARHKPTRPIVRLELAGDPTLGA
ncbi:MAG TPA: GNAT family N-acetyltransferase [Burkholderiaceae bacterium]|nr:GNAT family N-acetyltransferase [Burkholderiaceae bacterium]